MRQFRQAAGFDSKQTIEVLNETIRELYGESMPASGDEAGRRLASQPRPLTAAVVEQIERGAYNRIEGRTKAAWIRDLQVDRGRLNASRVPAWLVRAYDVAYAADGLLVDMYLWSVALQGEQLRDRPRRLRDLPARVPPGGEVEFLTRHLGELDAEYQALVEGHAVRLAAIAERQRTQQTEWAASSADASGARGEGEDEAPEGSIVSPRQIVSQRFVLYNLGQVPWRDRLLYRIGSSSTGIASPPLVPIPDTDPGGSAEVRFILQAPRTPGTYRACLKMAFPDGTYCFPTTLVGLVVTLVVPPADIADPYREWPDHAG
jgi:hypothetical protein